MPRRSSENRGSILRHGFLKEPQDRKKWILWKEKIYTPTNPLWNKGVKTSRRPTVDPYGWRDTTVEAILGRMVNFKYYKKILEMLAISLTIGVQ